MAESGEDTPSDILLCNDADFATVSKHDRIIVHIDIDCFYAQVEMISNPSLRGKPVGIQQKNIVVTCNYEARAHGVQKLMAVKSAVEACPSLILVNGEDLRKYREMSEKIYCLLQSFSPVVEKLGLDENYVDVTERIEATPAGEGCLVVGHVYLDAQEPCTCGCVSRLIRGSLLAQEIRKQLKDELNISSCAGIAHNKLLAKLVGSVHKPDQQTTLYPSSALCMVQSLGSPRNLPGIGSSTYKKLEELGIDTIVKLRNVDLTHLSRAVGDKSARKIRQLSFGFDDSRVKITDKPKSIGAEDGFPAVHTTSEIRTKMKSLLARVWTLVERDGRQPSQVKLSVRRAKQLTRESRQTALHVPGIKPGAPLSAGHDEKIVNVLMQLFNKVVGGEHDWQVNLLGISFSGLIANTISTSCSGLRRYFGPVSSSTRRASDGAPSAKRVKLDNNVLNELPPEIRREIEESYQQQKVSVSPRCPEGVDPLVFSQLPADIQEELINEKGPREQPPPPPDKPRNLLQYFRKL